MLSAFYTTLLKYINNNSTINEVKGKFTKWKNEYELKSISDIQDKENLINELFEKKNFADKKYEDFIEKNNILKKEFENSSVDKKKYAFENWINFQERVLTELINISQE